MGTGGNEAEPLWRQVGMWTNLCDDLWGWGWICSCEAVCSEHVVK